MSEYDLRLRSNRAPPLRSSEITEFLEKFQERFPARVIDSYLVRWAETLASFGTPLSFLDLFEIQELRFSVAGSTYPCFFVPEGFSARRAELMREQVKYFEGQNDDVRWRNLDLAGCLLCQNTAELTVGGVDAGVPARSSLWEYDDYFVIPNRYPYQPGSALVFPKRHRNSKRGNLYLVGDRQRKSDRPALTDFRGLHTIFALSDEFELYALRNHPQDGMSIPEHDHLHLIPSCLIPEPVSRCFRQIRPAELTVSFPDFTPFSTLALSGGSLSERAAAAADILAILDEREVVYTFVYLGGVFLVTPRKNRAYLDSSIKIGGGVGIHCFNPDNEVSMQRIVKHVPLKGEFPWEDYLPPSIEGLKAENC